MRGWLPKPSNNEHIFEYAADFTVPFDFGNPGAILVSNLHGKEVYLMEIVVHGFDEGPIFFPANTWIHSCKDNPDDRIIFRNQVSVVYQGFFFSLLNFCVSFCLRDVHVVVYRHIYHHKHHLGLKIYGVRTCSAFVEMERARESLMIEFMIMLFIMIWVILTRMKNLLDRPWAVRSGLILGAVELVDLQPRKVQCSPENFI